MSSALTQSGRYIPDDDRGLYFWLQRFAGSIHADPSRVGLSAADAGVLMRVYNEYREAFEATQDPARRTTAAIAWKDAVRASALATVRTYTALIRANMGVDNQTLVEIGMNRRNYSRTPVPRPRSAPLIAVRAAFNGAHELVYCDEATPHSRRKPFGVIYLRLHWFVLEPGSPAITSGLDPMKAKHIACITKTPFTIDHDVDDAGRTAVYFGQWMTGTGLGGPWSTACWFTIAGGSEAPAAMQRPKREKDAEPLRAAA
jgi:hypothetical protein